MNRQITRLAVGTIVLLSALIIGTTYWQTFAVAGLADRQDNSLARVATFTVDRGKIYAGHGRVLLATNVKRKVSGQTYYFRKYPNGYLAPHIVGYSTQSRSRAGLERSENDYLTGANGDIGSVTKHELDKLTGVTIKGNDVDLALNLRAQEAAVRALRGKCGAAVAIQPQTGRILALASSATYNPNAVEKSFSAITRIRTAACPFAAPLLNRATQGLYPPGSTFKMVTAAAALDSGAYTPSSPFTDPGYCVEYGQHVSNAGNPDQNGPEAFGTVTLAQGFEHSINSVFCNVGKHIGGEKILEYAKRFGFYSLPPLETPPSERLASGLYKNGRLFDPTNESQIDPGRLAFGQFSLLSTPLQMAMVGQAIANGGEELQPYLVDRIVAPDGSLVSRTTPHSLGRPIKPQTAAELNQMMQLVVQGGTAASVGFPPGLKVAGKTGTAELGLGTVYDAWFVCFAPADNPRYVVAAVVQKQPNGFGASVAAPIAKAILEKLMGG